MRRKYKYSIETGQPNTDLQPQITDNIINTVTPVNTTVYEQPIPAKEVAATEKATSTVKPVVQITNSICSFCGKPINKNLPHCKYCGYETYKSLKTHNYSEKKASPTEKKEMVFLPKINLSFIFDTIFDIHNYSDLTPKQIAKLKPIENSILRKAAFLFPHFILAYYNKYFNLCIAFILSLFAFFLTGNVVFDIISIFIFLAPSFVATRLFPKYYEHPSLYYDTSSKLSHMDPEQIFKDDNNPKPKIKTKNKDAIFKDEGDYEKIRYEDEEKNVGFEIPLKVKNFLNDINDRPKKRNIILAVIMLLITILSIVICIKRIVFLIILLDSVIAIETILYLLVALAINIFFTIRKSANK